MEGARTTGADGVAIMGTAVVLLGKGDVSGFVKRPQMRHEIAITHRKFGFEILETPLRARGEKAHDGEAPFLMNDLVELGEVNHADWLPENCRAASPIFQGTQAA